MDKEFNYFFDTVKKNNSSQKYYTGSYGEYFAGEDRSSIDIAIIGVPETRNSFSGSYDAGLDEVREYFYNLASVDKVEVVDYGNLKRGSTVKDTYSLLSDVTTELLKKNIIPLFFGGTHDNIVPIFSAMSGGQREVVIVDSRFDTDDDEFHSRSFINSIDKQEGFYKTLLGYQTYFVSEEVIKAKTEECNWDFVRLSTVRNKFSSVEPVIRDADFMSIDLSCVRQGESQGVSFWSPNGLYAEEVCKLAHQAGISDKMKIFGVYEYNSDNDFNGQSAHLTAQIIWHFIKGFSMRMRDYPITNLDKYKKIHIKTDKSDTELVFYKNEFNNRFWIEIPLENKQQKVFSCSEEDYLTACNNGVSDRIWKIIKRFV